MCSTDPKRTASPSTHVDANLLLLHMTRQLITGEAFSHSHTQTFTEPWRTASRSMRGKIVGLLAATAGLADSTPLQTMMLWSSAIAESQLGETH